MLKIAIRSLVIISFVMLSHHVFSQPSQITIAVLDFKDNSPFASEDLKSMQPGLADMMITTLAQVGTLKVVERRQLSALIDEMALGQSGMINESNAQQVGKLLGAHYLVLGSFMKGFKNDIRIDCRIVQTETGVTFKADEVSGQLKDILELIGKLGEKVIKNLDLKLNSKEKNAIKALDLNCPYEVILEYFQALELIEQKQYRKADALLTQVIQTCPDFHRAKVVQKELRASFTKKNQ